MSTDGSLEPERIVIETSAVLVALLFAFTQLVFVVLPSLAGESVSPPLQQVYLDALSWMASASLFFIGSAFVAAMSVMLTTASIIEDKSSIVAMRLVAYGFFVCGLAILIKEFFSMLEGTRFYMSTLEGYVIVIVVFGLALFLVLNWRIREKEAKPVQDANRKSDM
jgi:hypothetical protein